MQENTLAHPNTVAHPDYAPPAIEILGSVHELTQQGGLVNKLGNGSDGLLFGVPILSASP